MAKKHRGTGAYIGSSGTYSTGGSFSMNQQLSLQSNNAWYKFKAVGGLQIFSGGYSYHVFRGTSSLTVGTTASADILVIAGGGGGANGGGSAKGGGGGAGGTVVWAGQSLTPGSYPVTVGGGSAASR